MEIFLGNVGAFSQEPMFEQGFPLVSEQRKERIEALQKKEAKYLSLGAGLLLRHGFLQTIGQDLSHEIALGAHGQPYLPKGQVYFNLSHSKEFVLCVISDRPIGCDIEAFRQINPRLLKKVCTPEELAYALTLSQTELPDFFFTLWTRKESFVKWMGRGIGYPFSNIPVWTGGKFQEGISFEGRTLHWKSYEKDGYAMAICAEKNDFPIRIREIDTEMLTNY